VIPEQGRDERATFVQSAGRLAGMAGVLLGWLPDEFWAATPAELACVLQAMTGEGEATLCAAEVERLKAMFPDG